MTALFTQAREAMARAVATDEIVAAFVTSIFGSGAKLTVFRDHDTRNRPKESDAPFLALGPSTRAQPDKDVHLVEHAMPMQVCVHPGGEPVKDSDGVVTTQAAVDLDQLAEVVEKAASRGLLEAGFAFKQEPFLPDDDEDRFLRAFYLYRIGIRRIL